MTEWKEYKLGEIINLKRGYDLPKSKRESGFYPIVSSSGITDFHKEYMKLPPGVVTGRYGTIGKVFFIKEPYWPLNTTLYITDFKGNEPKFIFYYLQSFDFEKFSDKSTVPGINRNHLHTEEVKIPLLPEQKAIASVLSSLDDKIDLLHRQNKTLEEMAEALFRQWFLPAEASAQAVVVEASESWEEGVLGDLMKFNYGKSLPQKNRTGTDYPVYGSSGITDYHSEYLVEGPGIVTGRKGTLGLIMYSFESFYPIDTTFYITNNREESNLLFDYFFLKQLNLSEMNTDSAVPGLNRGNAEGIEILIPPTTLIQEFESVVEPKFRKIKANYNQIRTLEKLRDSLLPKLMSGEVRVKK